MDRRQDWRLKRFVRQLHASWTISDAAGQVKWQGDTIVEVSFRNAPVDDERLREIAQALEDLPDLQRLDLVGTQVTDAGLACLEGLPKLEEVGAARTSISPGAIERLLRSLAERRAPSFRPEGFSE